MEAYEAARQRHIEHLLSQIAGHFERVAWSAERLRAERTAQLRELVGMAVQRSSWHRDRLGDVDLTTLDEDALRDLPVMTKDDLMGNFDVIVTDPEVRLADANAHIAKLDGVTRIFATSCMPLHRVGRAACGECSCGVGMRGRRSS